MKPLKLFLTAILFASNVLPQIIWQKHKSSTADNLHNAFFINDQTGWVISHRSGLILQTEDGGKNWKIQARLGENYLESIYFVDEKHGFVVGNRNTKGVSMWETRDSGETWQAMKTDFPNLHRIVSSGRTLWLVGADGAIYSTVRIRKN